MGKELLHKKCGIRYILDHIPSMVLCLGFCALFSWSAPASDASSIKTENKLSSTVTNENAPTDTTDSQEPNRPQSEDTKETKEETPNAIEEGEVPLNVSALKSGVVKVETRILASALPFFGTSDIKRGTGFLYGDKKSGLILTNRHMICESGPAVYHITLLNGQEMEAKLVYADPHHDFAFLAVSPEDLPEQVHALESRQGKHLQRNAAIFFIGQPEGNDFSVHTGYINDPYSTLGIFRDPIFSCRINSSGGASGSPVLDNEGYVLGIIFGGIDSGETALCVPGRLAYTAYQHLIKRRTPPRKHIGVLFGSFSLARAEKRGYVPESLVKLYLEKFPEANLRVFRIENILKDAPASGILESGDILWTVNDQLVGPDLCYVEELFNNASKPTVTIGVYRKGLYKVFDVPLYDLHDAQLKRFLLWGGMHFYEADDWTRVLFDIPLGTLVASKKMPYAMFDFPVVPEAMQYFCFQIDRIDQFKVQTLEDFVKAIWVLHEKKINNFGLWYRNLGLNLNLGLNGLKTIQEVIDVRWRVQDPGDVPKIFEFSAQPWGWNPQSLPLLQVTQPPKQSRKKLPVKRNSKQRG